METDTPGDIELLETMVKAMVSNQDAVKTERTVDDMGVLLSLHVAADDMGTIIGKEGKTAKALRTILRAFGSKSNARINLKVIEPEGSTHVRRDQRESEDAATEDAAATE